MLLTTLLFIEQPKTILFIVIILVLFFGAKRIPELFRGIGQGVREFKDASSDPNKAPQTHQPYTPPVQQPYNQQPYSADQQASHPQQPYGAQQPTAPYSQPQQPYAGQVPPTGYDSNGQPTR